MNGRQADGEWSVTDGAPSPPSLTTLRTRRFAFFHFGTLVAGMGCARPLFVPMIRSWTLLLVAVAFIAMVTGRRALRRFS
eukprot:SAG11_NODE_3797_length_2220_cov_3.224422_1_plen_80_part_00